MDCLALVPDREQQMRDLEEGSSGVLLLNGEDREVSLISSSELSDPALLTEMKEKMGQLEKKFSKKLKKLKKEIKELKNDGSDDEDGGKKLPSKWASTGLVVFWSAGTFLLMTYGESILSPAGAALMIGICGKQLATVMKASLRTTPLLSYPIVITGLVAGSIAGFGFSHKWGVDSFLLSLSSLLGVGERVQKLFMLGKIQKLVSDCSGCASLCGRVTSCVKGMGSWIKNKICCCIGRSSA